MYGNDESNNDTQVVTDIIKETFPIIISINKISRLGKQTNKCRLIKIELFSKGDSLLL